MFLPSGRHAEPERTASRAREVDGHARGKPLETGGPASLAVRITMETFTMTRGGESGWRADKNATPTVWGKQRTTNERPTG